MRVFWCPNSLKTAQVMISWWSRKNFNFAKLSIFCRFWLWLFCGRSSESQQENSHGRQHTVHRQSRETEEKCSQHQMLWAGGIHSFLSKIYLCNNIFIFYLTIPFCWQYRQPLWFENVLEYKEKTTSWNLYSHTKYQYLFLSYFESKNKLK